MTLAEMQAKYPWVASPSPEWKQRTDELRGESFELFDGTLVLGVFHFDNPLADDAQTVVHMVVPTSHVKLSWSVGGDGKWTETIPTTKSDSSTYFDRSLHGSTILVELQELDGVPCSRKARLRIR